MFIPLILALIGFAVGYTVRGRRRAMLIAAIVTAVFAALLAVSWTLWDEPAGDVAAFGFTSLVFVVVNAFVALLGHQVRSRRSPIA